MPKRNFSCKLNMVTNLKLSTKVHGLVKGSVLIIAIISYVDSYSG